MHVALQPAAPVPAPPPRERLRFGRNEISGAFGDVGTDLPLLVGMMLAAGLDAAGVLVMFGVMQVATGLAYRMPMPVQPLKAVAVIVIAQRVPAGVVHGGGLAIGMLMLALAATGTLDWLARVVPRVVVRGLQLGLGLHLSRLALGDYIPALGAPGLALAALAAAVVLPLLGNRRVPPAPFAIALGIAYAALFAVPPLDVAQGIGFSLPRVRVPAWGDIAAGFVLLALPQIPLSLGNSVLATRQLAADLFPEREPPTVRRIGLTYGAMNVIAPFLGGVPTCHGSGGLAGHYALGGRTGGSVVIYGAMFLVLGLLFSSSFAGIVRVFPLPVLGVLLLVEAGTLMLLLRDLPARSRVGLPLAVLVGLIVLVVPYGYVAGMVIGTAAYRMLAGPAVR